MDANALIEMHDATLRQREIDFLLTFTTLESDVSELQNEKRRNKRKIQTLLGVVEKDYPETYSTCRDLGHSWTRTNQYFNENDDLTRELCCTMCRSYRHDIITSSGDVAHRRYDYNEGYMLQDVGKSPQKSFWRGLAFMVARRSINQ